MSFRPGTEEESSVYIDFFLSRDEKFHPGIM